MPENKIIPIIKPYLDWLTDWFGNLADEAQKNNVDAGAIADDFLSAPSRRLRFRDEFMLTFCSQIMKFWQENEVMILEEVRTLPGLKAHFGGDLGPQFTHHPFERSGLYFDTVLVPDPMLKIAALPDSATKTKEYYLLKYAILQIQFKPIYLADVYPPIAVLYPTKEELQAPPLPYFEAQEIAKLDSVALTNKLYEQKLEDFDQVQHFFTKFRNLDDCLSEITHPDIIFLDETVPRDPQSQFESLQRQAEKNWNTQFIENWGGSSHVLFAIYTRMQQANDNLQKAMALNRVVVMKEKS